MPYLPYSVQGRNRREEERRREEEKWGNMGGSR